MTLPSRLSALTDEELVRVAHAEFDSLTSTPLELELLRRFEQRFEVAELLEAIDEYDFTPAEITTFGETLIAGDVKVSCALLDALLKEDIDSVARLQAALTIFRKFQSLAEDAGDIFSRLSTLTESIQEEN